MRALLCSPVSRSWAALLFVPVSLASARLSHVRRRCLSAFSFEVPRENFRVLHGPSASAIASAPTCEAPLRLCGLCIGAFVLISRASLLSERCRVRP